MTRDPEDLARYVELFHEALDAGGLATRHGHGREGDWVDCSAEAVVEALLNADWRPPSAEPCTWCEHTRSRHSAGGCSDCGCTMPYGGS